MDAYDCITTKIEVREYSDSHVSDEVKRRVLEAARLTQSSMNVQNWRFIMVESRERLGTLAKDSTTGSWVGKADFAVVVLTSPKYQIFKLDAGRAVQDMQLAAWNDGVGSGVYTGVDVEAMRRDFAIPESMEVTMVVAFGYPRKKVIGRKNRKPLSEVAFSDKYGQPVRF